MEKVETIEDYQRKIEKITEIQGELEEDKIKFLNNNPALNEKKVLQEKLKTEFDVTRKKLIDYIEADPEQTDFDKKMKIYNIGSKGRLEFKEYRDFLRNTINIELSKTLTKHLMTKHLIEKA